MFRPFLDSLRRHGVPASLREYLDLLAGLQAGLSDWTPEGFYHLARATLIKNEAHIDRFDRAFAETFAGLDDIPVEALVDEVAYRPIGEVMEETARRIARVRVSPEGQEGVRAFLDKRPPSWAE